MKNILILISLIAAASIQALAQYQPHIIWDRSGLTDSAAYGTQILPLGDQNDDGFADWAVVAWGNIGYGGTQSAYLEFFYGGDTLSEDPYLVYHGDQAEVHPVGWTVML